MASTSTSNTITTPFDNAIEAPGSSELDRPRGLTDQPANDSTDHSMSLAQLYVDPERRERFMPVNTSKDDVFPAVFRGWGFTGTTSVPALRTSPIENEQNGAVFDDQDLAYDADDERTEDAHHAVPYDDIELGIPSPPRRPSASMAVPSVPAGYEIYHGPDDTPTGDSNESNSSDLAPPSDFHLANFDPEEPGWRGFTANEMGILISLVHLMLPVLNAEWWDALMGLDTDQEA
ncbi:hypothetical protein NEMBOFW57_008342 [Staphylotrichum longicolle]|uniref:Uncharacterized protein n=1 Tax=Staphylotrichum longicolle TaxID=669026 RepID=A0AAD4EVE3_9PEZI|nr:hypothetical protein NEMBOFW57_008342 [Staphylotrichum longicolle]